MDAQRRALRGLVSAMAPCRAVAYIRAFELPEEEETCIVEIDVRGRSCQQVAQLLHVCPEVVKRRRRRAYGKMLDAIEKGMSE